MGQQSKTGFGVANPVPYSPDSRLKNLDTNPSDQQPPGVDEEPEYQSLEEALTGD
tara:strand:+ start:915 stop:1079 length:165 start_codon:yes stop_codon:yes gene_type:complete